MKTNTAETERKAHAKLSKFLDHSRKAARSKRKKKEQEFRAALEKKIKDLR